MLTNLWNFKSIKFYLLTEVIRTDHDFENILELSYLKKIY